LLLGRNKWFSEISGGVHFTVGRVSNTVRTRWLVRTVSYIPLNGHAVNNCTRNLSTNVPTDAVARVCFL
jgi:hypothetical protein